MEIAKIADQQVAAERTEAARGKTG
jgi:hypothetical protein